MLGWADKDTHTQSQCKPKCKTRQKQKEKCNLSAIGVSGVHMIGFEIWLQLSGRQGQVGMWWHGSQSLLLCSFSENCGIKLSLSWFFGGLEKPQLRGREESKYIWKVDCCACLLTAPWPLDNSNTRVGLKWPSGPATYCPSHCLPRREGALRGWQQSLGPEAHFWAGLWALVWVFPMHPILDVLTFSYITC